MAGRKKPNSGKAKKAQLSAKRAQKAASHTPTLHPLDALTAAPQHHDKAPLSTGTSRQKAPVHPDDVARQARKLASLNLESRFLRLPASLIDSFHSTLSVLPLPRPISHSAGILRLPELDGLSCPARPKWHYTQTKKEVEKNEEGVFRKWLESQDALVSASLGEAEDEKTPTFFERNLQVWRQLWRVTEVSDILCVLLDVRMPLLHYPPSLQKYLRSLKPRKKLILVLTKTDLVPPEISEAWKRYFEETEKDDEGGACAIVLMESYKESERTILTQGTQPRYIPHAATSSRTALLSALQLAHTQLVTPPSVVAASPEKLARWSPRVRREVDWESIVDPEEMKAQTEKDEEQRREERRKKAKEKRAYVPRRKRRLGVGEESASESEEEAKVEEQSEAPQPVEEKPWVQLEGDAAHPFITIGLIGQPNVGKSSLLNALLSRKVVRASRTPGKTKTLQTIFWNKTVRLCDCPGLVCPSAVGMENQVLAGILPIQNVELVVHFIAQRLRLEAALGLESPSSADEMNLRSLAEGATMSSDRVWTTDELLTEFAERQGFITAKAARPDLYRAGAVILRSLHSSLLPWSFRPSSAFFDTEVPDTWEEEGIWLRGFSKRKGDEDEDVLQREEDREEGTASGSSVSDDSAASETEASDESEDEDEGEASTPRPKPKGSAFAALQVEDGSDEDEEESDEH